MNEDQHIIDHDTTEAVEMSAVPEGEYKVIVLKSEFKHPKPESDKEWIALTMMLDIPDEQSADFFNHMHFLPHKSQDPKNFQRALGDLKVLKQAFGIPESQPFTPDDLVGKEAWAYLTIDDDPQYGRQNRIKRWVTGPQTSY